MKNKLFSRGKASIVIVVALMIFSAGTLWGQVSFSKAFLPGTIGPGSSTRLIFSLSNPVGTPLTDLSFTDPLPAGVFIAAAPGIESNCGGQVTAPAGGTTISLAEGILGAPGNCSISVNVTSAAVGTHTNTSDDLFSGAVMVASGASADLVVVSTRPGFSKSFSPAGVVFGGRSTLTFTIDNTANNQAAFNPSFSDTLPSGIRIASPPVSANTCAGTTLSAPGGGQLISLSSNFAVSVPRGGSCTVSVDVIAESVGILENVSGELTSASPAFQSSGFATASLTVTVQRIVLTKEFIDDPVPPGGNATLQFEIRNLDRRSTATNISFTDDLNAALGGMVAVGLPLSDVCGQGSTLSGTGLVSFSGGALDPEAICTFDVSVQVPGTAVPGTYTNTTSAVSADLDGTPAFGESASDVLVISPDPVLTKTFIPNIVGAGDSVQLEFSITNTSTTDPATGLTFSDVFVEVFQTASMIPADGFCGPSSEATFTPLTNPGGGSSTPAQLVVTGASLAAGDTCTFSIDLDVIAGAPAGEVPNTTSEITGLVGGLPVTGRPATASVFIIEGPRLLKEFVTDPVAAGGTVDLMFTISLGEDVPAQATGISFMDDLDAALTGLVATGLPQAAVCGAGSSLSGTSTLLFSGGSLLPGETCSFTVTLQVPAGALPGPYTNTTSQISSEVLGTPATGPAATNVLLVAGLQLTKEFIDDPVLPGATVTLRFTVDNLSAIQNATDIGFSDDLDDGLAGLVATGLPINDVCGAGSVLAGFAGNSLIQLVGGSLPAGTSCSFDVTLQVPATADPGDYVNRTSLFRGAIDGNLVLFPNAVDVLTVVGDFLSLVKEFVDDPVAPGENVQLRFTIDNSSATESVTDISFTDDLSAALFGLTNVGGALSDICGMGSSLTGTDFLTFAGGSLAAGASCTFFVTLSVPADALLGTEAVNTTSNVTGFVGAIEITGEPAADVLFVDYATLTKSFSGSGMAGGQVILSFTIQNFAFAAIGDVSFTDDLSSFLPGLTATGLPAFDVCGLGSQLDGTDMLTLTGAVIPAGTSCTISVVLDIPLGAAAGDYLNTTSALFQSEVEIGAEASATLTIEADPDADGDGVPDAQDACLGTQIPEGVPTEELGVNRFALVDGDLIFDTVKPKGTGPKVVFTTEDTAGCSCEQIIAALGLGSGHVKHGCSKGVMEEWIELVAPLQPKTSSPWKGRPRGSASGRP